LIFKRNNVTDQLFIITLSSILGILNTTKIPESDLIMYIDEFTMATQYSLLGYLSTHIKEPLFWIITYSIAYITNANTNIYIFFLTTLSYIFILNAVKKFYDNINIKIDNSFFIFIMFITISTPWLFGYSAHLIRQFLSFSIILFVLVNKVFYNKNSFILFLSSVLIHTSSILFFPLLYIKVLRSKISFKHIFIILIIYSTFIFLLVPLSQKIINIYGVNYYTYLLIRLSNYADLRLIHHSIFPRAFVIINLISLIILYKIHISDIKPSNYPHHFINILFISFMFLLLFYNTDYFHRYIIFYFFTWPLIIPQFLIRTSYLNISARFLMLMISYTYLVYQINNGTWNYKNMQSVFQSNFVSTMSDHHLYQNIPTLKAYHYK